MTAIITVQKAIAISALHTLLYVGVLYLREASRPSTTKSKDFPSVIKARFAGVIIACILSVFINRYIINQARQSGQRTEITVWDNILGGWGELKLDLNQTFLAWRLTALLFLGPLVERLWILEGWRGIGSGVTDSLTSLNGWRNYIIVLQSLKWENVDFILGPCFGRNSFSRMYYTPLSNGPSPSFDNNIHNSSLLWLRYTPSLYPFTLMELINSTHPSCIRT